MTLWAIPSSSDASSWTLHRRCFFGRLDCEAVLNPISGHVFDEGHGESGVVRSAEWHDDDWLDDRIREAWLLCFVGMVVFQKFLPWLRAK
ncbi:hypothetical protein TNCV_2458271 [Trichonephila clavipes]|nr:hypothetical protein TNCV_2458271 [Trichonephila clavipes]